MREGWDRNVTLHIHRYKYQDEDYLFSMNGLKTVVYGTW